MPEAKFFTYHRDPRRVIEGFPQQEHAVDGLIDLCRYVKLRGGHDAMVELGSAYGESAQIFKQQGFDKVWCIDQWLINEGTEPLPEESFDLRAQEFGLLKIKKHSRVAAIGWDCLLDLVYIDADHRFDAVAGDILKWNSKVKHGGFIGGHDYDNPWCMGVKLAVDYLFGKPDQLFADSSWVVQV